MSKVILVTGGSSGIGKAICEYLHEKGYKVYGTSRNPQKIKTPLAFPLIQLDVQDESSVIKGIEDLISKEGRIDVLVNNAGVGMLGSIEDGTVEEVQEIFDINVFGILRTCRVVLPYMRKQKQGLIINVSSIAGHMGLPYRGIYSASKASVGMITEAMRMEIKPFGIKACVVDPGDFSTAISDNRRVAKATRISSAYKKEAEGIEALINSEVGGSSDPMIVGKLIHGIIEKKNPSVRYLVGKPLQKLSILVRGIVSGNLFEKIIMGHYKMK
jgi:NADP-dependent 3-hydroxy acid dehydrogenase YdfG